MRTVLIGRYRCAFPYSENKLDYPVMKALSERLGPVDVLVVAREGGARLWREAGLTVRYAPAQGLARTGPGFVLWAVRETRALHRAAPVDIVNGSDPWGGLAGVLLQRSIGVKVLAQLQGDFLPPSPWVFGPFKRAVLHRLVRCICRRADGLRCLYEESAAQAAALGVPRSRIAVVPTRCDVNLFDGARLDGAGPARRRLIYVGSLAPRKGVGFLLEAFRELGRTHPDATLTIVGEGSLDSALREAARRLGVEERTRFLGPKPHDALPGLLRDSDVFAFPSLSEATPRAVLEAMAMSLPVVATKVGGMSALIEEGRTGLLVPPGDPGALAAALRKALDDKAWAREAGRLGRLRVVAEFSLERHIDAMVALHRRLHESGRASP